jgi:protein-disulfide isomerase-like protein with CxxC motif
MSTEPGKTTVDMWFDPLCPWAWITSRWLLEVELVRPVEVGFHVMSLSILNENRTDLSPEDRERLRHAVGQVRLCIAAEKHTGNEVLRPLYTALGQRRHVQGRQFDAELYREALAEVGLPVELANAAESTEYDTALRASHEAGMAPAGPDVGTPMLHVPTPDGPKAFFGPVVTPAPKGEAAGRLWDGTLLLACTPGYYEIKRGRELGPIFD